MNDSTSLDEKAQIDTLTLFTCPKPFTDPHMRQIQRNAIGSWLELKPRPDILLLGDEEGIAEAAAEFSVRHIPELERNEYGTPLVSSIFKQAENASSKSFLCYVNTDIILLSDFMKVVNRLAWHCHDEFLMVGQRWDVEINGRLNFASVNWENDLQRKVAKMGVLHAITGMDYFLFPRRFWSEIPPFALGRSAWDNWFVYRARAKGAVVIDATNAITAVHQQHDYEHVLGGKAAAWAGPEAIRNRELVGAKNLYFTVGDATHKIFRGSVVRNSDESSLEHRMRHQSVLDLKTNFIAKIRRLLLTLVYTYRNHLPNALWRKTVYILSK